MKALQQSASRYPTGFSAVIASQAPAVPAVAQKTRGIWNDDIVEEIKKLVQVKVDDKCLTAEAIGERLGLTRSQVLGICWRRGIQIGDRSPAYNHVPKQRAIGKRILKRGQAVTEMVLGLPDPRPPRSNEVSRIVRKPTIRKTIEAAPLLPLFDAAPIPDTNLNTTGADFIRQYKKRTQKAKSPAVAEAKAPLAVESPATKAAVPSVVEIAQAPVAHLPASALVIQEKPAAVEPKAERDFSKCLTIFDLRDRHCRYPVKGTGVSMLYCSEPAPEGKSYCSHCATIVYEKPEKIEAKKPARRKMSGFAIRNGINFR